MICTFTVCTSKTIPAAIRNLLTESWCTAKRKYQTYLIQLIGIPLGRTQFTLYSYLKWFTGSSINLLYHHQVVLEHF